MARKPGFTLEQHKETGRDLKEIKRLLQKFLVETYPAFPQKSRAGKARRFIDKALDATNEAKHEMEEQLVLDVPGLSSEEFGPIYYGSDSSE